MDTTGEEGLEGSRDLKQERERERRTRLPSTQYRVFLFRQRDSLPLVSSSLQFAVAAAATAALGCLALPSFPVALLQFFSLSVVHWPHRPRRVSTDTAETIYFFQALCANEDNGGCVWVRAETETVPLQPIEGEE